VFSNTGLAAGTTYGYRVAAYNAAGNSAYSNTATATTQPAPTVPIAPSNLTAGAVSSAQINLAWSDNSTDEQGFRIERRHGTGNWALMAAVGPNATSYSNSGLRSGITYYYRVSAFNASGNSAYSNEANATTPGTGRVLLSETFDTYASGAFPPSWQLIYSGAGSSRQYVDTTHSSSAPKALRLEGSSCWSANAFRPVSLPSPTLGKKVTVSANVFVGQRGVGGCTNHRAAVGLHNPSGATWGRTYGGVLFGGDGYIYAFRDSYDDSRNVRLMPYTIGSWLNVKSIVDLQSKTFSVWVDGVLMVQNARSYDLDYNFPTGVYLYAGHGSSPNSTVWFDNVIVSEDGAAVAKPSAPTNLDARAASRTQINLTWRDNANNEQGFRVERKIGTGLWTQIVELPANTTSYANGGLTRNTSYRYRVRASNAGGTSAWATSGVVRTPR
jgi:titin